MTKTKCDIEKNWISPINIMEIPGETINTYNGFKKNFHDSKKNLFNNTIANKNIKNFLK